MKDSMTVVLLLFCGSLSTFAQSSYYYGPPPRPFSPQPFSPQPLLHPGYLQVGPPFPTRIGSNKPRQESGSLLDSMGFNSRHFNLPSMRKVSETLGALNVLGRYFLKKSNFGEANYPTLPNSSDEDDDLYHNPTQLHEKIIAKPHLTIPPEEDEKLGSALYTLGRNVLGQNVTDSLVPVVNTVSKMGKFLPPLIYRDGRIVIGPSANSTSDGGDIRNVFCTTPDGSPGTCLDLSGCPSLLFDLTNLRKSLCFKALFVPGVCCPDPSFPSPVPTRRPFPPAINNPIPQTSTTITPIQSTTASVDNTHDSDCGTIESPSFRIVGGAKSVPGNWPWMAAIFLHGPKGTEFWCGGTLISKQYILTAAHCTKDQKQKSFTARQFSVRLGDYDLMKTDDLASPTVFRVAEIIAHPEFSGMGFYNDVALLKLDREAEYNRFIRPICLPEGRAALNSFVGTFATVIGWGTDKYGGRENSALQEVKLPVWSNSECDKTYFQPITDIFLCAGLPSGGKDACQGDSGGPLMLELETGKWTQVGIVSFGNRCAEPGYPGVYTRLTKFTSWIAENAV